MSSTPLVASPTSSVDFAVPTFIANEATQAVVASSSQLSTGLSGSQLSVGALLSTIAEKFKVSSTTLLNTVTSESEMNPNAVGDHGLAVGLTQIHYKEWGFTKDQVLDPEFSLTFLAKHIKAGDAWKYWTSLNCYTYLLYAQNIPLPPMAQIVPNTNIAHVGEVAIFWYRDKETGQWVKHVALVTKLLPGGNFEVLEANFEAGKVGRRIISRGDSHLQGFWDRYAQ